ncbi:hypothetical protein TRFO_07269 [Tritrichomonas foetus]|uniref:Abasic site processing protein n=1 Tax=Tritrichomonas foetus TaxID=1144522 RepID=A0A1J4JXU1_9EUKA|nr:hypothetical protein TRFO_07269 [Tritrichomonas foetus]|eukprot:OHT02085.1 hypothetical protein TRFO_07269 [Tritrichomonas foetus]
MCGRFALNRALGQLRANVNARRVNTNGQNFTPSNNIAPQRHVPVVTNNEISLMFWGVEKNGNTLINARSENVQNVFNEDIAERRCVVPAEGYFEWDKTKQPHFFKRNNNELLFLAAVYTKRNCFTILTRSASQKLNKIHERMPIIFSLSQIALWESSHWRSMLDDKPPELSFYPVSKISLRPGYTGPECVTEIKIKKQTDLLGFLKTQTKEKVTEVTPTIEKIMK